ncbi:VanZ family protein [Arthrobacter sp.]|uniref:VanZ family protein n=1 Tax=Arthrobacter sp. TaxID=1667 RepID=UPI002585FEF8|nr:VanZ family protein [Arthrobacter sp.]
MIKPHHRVALALAAAYVIALVLILLWPTPVDRPIDGTLNTVLNWAHRHGLPNAIGYNQVEFTANIAMFMPLGCFAALWSRRPWAAVGAGCFISCLVELSQTLFLPHRVGSLLDVLANTLGAALGAVVYHVAGRRRRLRLAPAPALAPGGAQALEIPPSPTKESD